MSCQMAAQRYSGTNGVEFSLRGCSRAVSTGVIRPTSTWWAHCCRCFFWLNKKGGVVGYTRCCHQKKQKKADTLTRGKSHCTQDKQATTSKRKQKHTGPTKIVAAAFTIAFCVFIELSNESLMLNSTRILTRRARRRASDRVVFRASCRRTLFARFVLAARLSHIKRRGLCLVI